MASNNNSNTNNTPSNNGDSRPANQQGQPQPQAQQPEQPPPPQQQHGLNYSRHAPPGFDQRTYWVNRSWPTAPDSWNAGRRQRQDNPTDYPSALGPRRRGDGPPHRPPGAATDLRAGGPMTVVHQSIRVTVNHNHNNSQNAIASNVLNVVDMGGDDDGDANGDEYFSQETAVPIFWG